MVHYAIPVQGTHLLSPNSIFDERYFVSGDYGPYGTGFDGYSHYMQAFNESQKGGGGGGGGRGPSSNGGCLSAVLYLLAAAFLLYALIVY